MNRAHWAVPLASVAVLVAGTLLAATAPEAGTRDSRFPHEKHARVFPLCSTCHAGVTESGQPLWPEPITCASCHDGVVEARVDWTPRIGPRPGNRRFTHDAHHRAVSAKQPADSTLVGRCSSCHVAAGAQRMTVENAVVSKCLACHGLSQSHFDNPPRACATCHVRLTDAVAMPPEEIARFPRPRSHESPTFLLGGHGRLARVHGVTSGRDAIAANCATCHTRNLCLSCHVNARQLAPVLALETDSRLPNSLTRRAPPPSHTWDFRERHGPDANARPASCETCHARSTCLECHRPDGGRQSAYHPAGFLTRHPSSAYNRSANCADCHNVGQFCQSCHQSAGLVARARIGPRGYHDAFRGFSLGHGQAARQNLESCASCHAERDCTACHSAVGGGFRFSPHGPGFNGERMRAKNPSLCAACHGNAVPARP